MAMAERSCCDTVSQPSSCLKLLGLWPSRSRNEDRQGGQSSARRSYDGGVCQHRHAVSDAPDQNRYCFRRKNKFIGGGELVTELLTMVPR